jgi:23S rRNA (uracil1939-C5)-methyltransferase
MPDSQPLKLRIEKLVAGGDGLAFHEGKAVFVPFALPGETVSATLSRTRKDFNQASLVEVLEPSRYRVAPSCPIYGSCGGCNLQHLAYARQVEEKALIVSEAFRRIGRIEREDIAAVPSLPFAYRNRVQLHFTAEGRLGFMRRSSSDLVEAAGCPVAVRSIQSWIEARTGSSRGYEELKPFVLGKDRFLVFGYGEEVWIEGERGIVEVRVSGEPIRFHLKGFFQSNLYLLDYFVPDALAGLSGAGAADLYCGVGLFGRFLARNFSRVTCVEHNPFALELAKANVPGKDNDFHALTVEDWIRTEGAKRRFDCVVVDPPRTGLSVPVREWLARSKPRALVYVSCDPVTLARDSGDLVRSGFVLESVKAFDFYPQTGHVECHARFTQA